MPHKAVHGAAGGGVEVAHEHGEDGAPLRGHHLSHGRQDCAQLAHLLAKLDRQQAIEGGERYT